MTLARRESRNERPERVLAIQDDPCGSRQLRRTSQPKPVPGGASMLKHFARSYYLMIALVLLFASSSALAARELHPAKARASQRGTRAGVALKVKRRRRVAGAREKSHGIDAST